MKIITRSFSHILINARWLSPYIYSRLYSYRIRIHIIDNPQSWTTNTTINPLFVSLLFFSNSMFVLLVIQSDHRAVFLVVNVCVVFSFPRRSCIVAFYSFFSSPSDKHVTCVTWYRYKTSEAPCIKALIQMGFERRIGRQGRVGGGTLSPGAQGAVAPAPTRAGGRSPRPMSPADGRSRPLSPSGPSGTMSMTKGAKEEEVTAMLRAEYRNVPESMLKNLIVKYEPLCTVLCVFLWHVL